MTKQVIASLGWGEMNSQGPGTRGKHWVVAELKHLEQEIKFFEEAEGHGEKQLCVVAASNIIWNFSFMHENDVIMAQHQHCLESGNEDEEPVTNALEARPNLGPLLDLQIFRSSKPSYFNINSSHYGDASLPSKGTTLCRE